MYELALHEDAEQDLGKLWENDEEAAADISALLEEIRDDNELLQAMSIHQRSEGRIHVSRWLEMRSWGKDIWRMKIWTLGHPDDVLPYRVIYAFDQTKGIYYVLGIMHRDQKYERDKDFVQRIKTAYRDLAIPEIR